MKQLIWLGSTRRDVRGFSDETRGEIGHALYKVQLGLEPSDWKPMPSIGSGVKEIRIHTGMEYRVIYIAKFTEAIYVLHAFEKKPRKTSKVDMDLARKRLAWLLAKR